MESRQCGRTTRQMQGAAQNSIFVWCNDHFAYPRNLARSLGRDDLELVSPGWLTSNRWRGRTLTGVVVDHAADLTIKQIIGLQEARMRIR